MLDGTNTFEEISAAKEKYFKEATEKNVAPKSWKDTAKSFGASALSTLGNMASSAILSIVGEQQKKFCRFKSFLYTITIFL